MNEALYWLWLQKSIGYAQEYSEIISYFGSVKALYEASDEERRECPRLERRNKLRERMSKYTLADAEKTVEICKRYGIKILTPADEEFPESLRNIPKAPAAIYVRGDFECLRSSLPVAVIGSRIPSKYGEECAFEIVSGLVQKANAVIISGGALGIDSIAHRAALKSGGKTVLVLGCGHGINYLPDNAEMRKQISRNGALVTEYPPFTSASPATFPERNRIISGLSKAVVIVEAAERSGTFSTANHAMRQNRKLLVLPGDIASGNFAGSNQLVSEGKATAIFSSEGVLTAIDGEIRKEKYRGPKNNAPFKEIDRDSEYSKKFRAEKRKKSVKSEKTPTEAVVPETEIKKIQKKLPETISKNAEIVYNLMSDGNCTMDEITNSSELTPAKILAALTELELEGVIMKTADAYSLI